MTTKTAPIQNLEIYPLDELMTHDPVAITVKVTCTRRGCQRPTVGAATSRNINRVATDASGYGRRRGK